MGTCKTTITLFQTKYIVIGACLLKEFNLLTDVFETGQYFDEFHIVVIRNRFCHIGCNNGRNKSRIFRHGTGCRSLTQNVFCNQHAGHIACKRNIFAGLCIKCIDTKSVCIRVCSKDNVSIFLLGKLQSKGKCLGIFRIGIIQCCKVWIRHFLFRYYKHVFEAKFGKNPSYRYVTGSVEWRIYNLDIICNFFNDFRMNDLFL